LFDPTNPLSARFNPLHEVRKGAHEVRYVQNITDILVDPEGAKERRDRAPSVQIPDCLELVGDNKLLRIAASVSTCSSFSASR